MPRLRVYNLFISHAWTYDEEYYRLVRLLDRAPLFSWQNYSVPEEKARDTRTKAQLLAALRRQIRPTHAVLILARMYVPHRDWVLAEIDIAAREMGKPLIGIRPRGGERFPRIVEESVDHMVGWSSVSIVGAIRRCAL